MKKILIIACLIFLACPVFAQEKLDIEPSTRKLCEQVLDYIQDELFSLRMKYDELDGFGSDKVTVNEYGFKVIEYKYKYQGRNQGFGLTVVGLNDTFFKVRDKDLFEMKFPLLGMKVQGYQKNVTRRKEFNFQNVIQIFVHLIRERQSYFLPFEFTVRPVKEEFYTDEDIEFKVTIKNTSNKIMVVKDLNRDSLFFIYNNREWGADALNSGEKKKIKRVTLRSGEALEKTFKSNGYSFPKVFNVFCTYKMSYMGVRPAAMMSVVVVDD